MDRLPCQRKSIPDAAPVQRLLLGALLIAIVARLAQRLQIVLIPEQPLVTAMRGLMVADELRRIALEQTAAALARVVIAFEYLEAQATPARSLIPGFPRRSRGHPVVQQKGRLHRSSQPSAQSDVEDLI
jgi:hypothetical protein